MDSAYTFGMLLVGLSAVLLASHWQHWRSPNQPQSPTKRWQDYAIRTIRRRTVASSLVGVIGLLLMAYETVPRSPLSITAYLFSLVFMTCWILWLACLDMMASRRFHDDQQLDQIANELRHAQAKKSKNGSGEN